jgi:hypothetical protein
MQFSVRCGYHPEQLLAPGPVIKGGRHELYCPVCHLERQGIKQLELPRLQGWSPSDPPLVLPRDLAGSRSK